MGRQGSPHRPTAQSRELAKQSSAIGLSHVTISILLKCDEKTLRKHYRRELDEGMAAGHFNVGRTTYQRAMAGDKTMLIWYEKTRMGMRETLQVTTPVGEPIETEHGEAELIGAYLGRLAIAAGADPARAHPRPDPGVGEGGQEPQGPAGRPAARARR